jgi:hypothetical protein
MKTKLRMIRTMILTAVAVTTFVAVSCTKKEEFSSEGAKEAIDAEKSTLVVTQETNGSTSEKLPAEIKVASIDNTGLTNPVGCLKQVKVVLNSATCSSWLTTPTSVLYYSWSYTPTGPYYSSTASNSCTPTFWLGPGTTYLRVSSQPNGVGSPSPLYSKVLPTCPGGGNG